MTHRAIKPFYTDRVRMEMGAGVVRHLSTFKRLDVTRATLARHWCVMPTTRLGVSGSVAARLREAARA
jgi:hypothetical protein